MPQTISCPHCEEVINHLDYRQDCTEYGNVDIDVVGGSIEAGNWDIQEHDNYGDTTYICPECGDEIDSLSFLRIEGEDDGETTTAQSTSCAESLTRQPLAGVIPQSSDFRERVEFCTACCELVESSEIQDGKCEMCRSKT